MRIVYHLGAHCTDEERLLRCLLKNRGVLAAQGILVPGPARYRTLLRETLAALKGEPATQDTQAMVLDQIMDEDHGERLVLSSENFLAYPQWVLRGALYPGAGERVRALTRLFPDISCEFHLAIRNPATFLPALFQKQKDRSYDDFIGDADPLQIRWSDLILRIRALNPDAPLTVWCDEDTPLLWPEVLRTVAGSAPDVALTGAEDFLATLMSPEGMARLRRYLSEHPPVNDAQYRRVVTAFLGKFALPDRIEMELDLPGWTEDYAARLGTLYDADVARIAAMPDVRLLLP
jgi:hypothetical protein